MIWLPAWALLLLGNWLNGPGRIHGTPGVIGFIGLIWLCVDVALTVVYGLYRMFFRAKRDAQVYSQPAPWQPPR
jgi:hypothetical protein